MPQIKKKMMNDGAKPQSKIPYPTTSMATATTTTASPPIAQRVMAL